MSKSIELENLKEIAKKICKAYEAVANGITPNELDVFESYVSQQEVMVPLLDPTGYMRGKDKLINAARRRVEALKGFFEK